jgi:hypothetical protein
MVISLNLWLKKIATLKEREKRTICTDSVMCFMKEATIRLDSQREKESQIERERATSRMSELTKGLPSPHVQTSCSVPIKTPALFFLLMDFVNLFS